MRLPALILLCFSAVAANAQDEDARPHWPTEAKKLYTKFVGIKSRLGFVSCIQDGHPSQYELDCDAKHTALQKQVDQMLTRIEITARAGVYAGESAYQSALKDTEAAAELLEQECENLLIDLESEE